MEPIISILNLKNGVGTSTLTWNIAHILELDIFQHEKAMHHFFKKERDVFVEAKRIISNSVAVYPIEKREFKSGVYDLGSDINYGYIRQIISKSDVVIIPIEVGAEVLMKTIATIQYVAQHNEECDIFIVFNKLDNSDPDRELKYTLQAESHIDDMHERLENKIVHRIKFHYIRYAFAMFRNLDEGNFFLDNFFLNRNTKLKYSNFTLLQHIRYHTLEKMTKSARKKDKIDRERSKDIKDMDFYVMHRPYYEEFVKSEKDLSILFNNDFIKNNRKIVKDMLALSTRIKRAISLPIWKEKEKYV